MPIQRPKVEDVVIYTSTHGRKYNALVLKVWLSGDETDVRRSKEKKASAKGVIWVDVVYVHEEESNGKEGTLTIENSVSCRRPGMKGRYWEYPRKKR